MKITKTQLKQIIKEELSKVLNEDINTMEPLDVLKQMIYEEHRGQNLASPENVQDYLEWIQDGVDDLYVTGNSPKESMANLQNQLKQSLEVIEKFQQAAAQGRGVEGGKIDLPAALGLSADDERFGFMNKPLGDPYQPISLKNWIKDLSQRGLFFDVIHTITDWYFRYQEPGD
tara:strand:- start:21 stop:539 length:519 start_codon:yes stop_codon:yes gene_type:complete